MADFPAVEMDRSVVHGDQPHDHVKTSRLPGAVRTQQPHDLTARHLERHILDHGARAVVLFESVDLQLAHRIRPVRRYGEASPSGSCRNPAGFWGPRAFSA